MCSTSHQLTDGRSLFLYNHHTFTTTFFHCRSELPAGDRRDLCPWPPGLALPLQPFNRSISWARFSLRSRSLPARLFGPCSSRLAGLRAGSGVVVPASLCVPVALESRILELKIAEPSTSSKRQRTTSSQQSPPASPGKAGAAPSRRCSWMSLRGAPLPEGCNQGLL